MKKILIAAFAAAVCMPFVTQAQGQVDELQALVDDSIVKISLLQEDEQTFADGEQLFAEGQMPPLPPGSPQGACPMMGQQDAKACPMMDGKQGPNQRPMMGRQGFMQRPMGQRPEQGQFGPRQQGFRGHGQMAGSPEGQQPGPRGQFSPERMAIDAQMAVVAPEKYAELKRLREQEAQIVKDFTVKLKADREAFKKLLDDYKATPSDDLKNQIKAKIAERIDALNNAREARLAEQGKKIEEARKDKDAKVDEFFAKLTSKDAPGDCPKDGKRPGHGPKGGPFSKDGDAKPMPPPPADKA